MSIIIVVVIIIVFIVIIIITYNTLVIFSVELGISLFPSPDIHHTTALIEG
jgi:hypothetical protein